MTVLDKLASALGRADEVPNQMLAQEIGAGEDHEAVHELVEHLTDKDKAIQHDCIKVLYEVGYARPDLISGAAKAFLKLLSSRDNRMVWGGMTALGAIAALEADAIWEQIDLVQTVTEQGSIITQDWGIRVMATVATQAKPYEERIWPFLLTFLTNCPDKDLPRHAESCLPAVTGENRESLLHILDTRTPTLKSAQARRIDQLVRKIKAL